MWHLICLGDVVIEPEVVVKVTLLRWKNHFMPYRVCHGIPCYTFYCVHKAI
jgi:hypothetical protein